MVGPTHTSEPDRRNTTGHAGWDAGDRGELQRGCAVAVRPSTARVEQARGTSRDLLPDEDGVRPARWTPAWRNALRDEVATVLASRQLRGAWFPALNVPRFVHGQSQGICDLFGAGVEPQEDGNYFVHPLRPNTAFIDTLKPRAIETSLYWGAVEWINYAHTAGRQQFAFRNPVMTGPFDTANYLLGTTVLMEWVYTEPSTLHRLLNKITEVIIDMLSAVRRAAGGCLHGDALACMRNAFCLCSECRSLVSVDIYEEFEAPYLARIGNRLGPYGIHSCGSWERTVPSALKDPHLRAMNGQVRENDLATLCALAKGGVMLSIGRSQNVHERYTWPDTESFFRHVLTTARFEQPMELSISESDLGLWDRLEMSIGRCASQETPAPGPDFLHGNLP